MHMNCLQSLPSNNCPRCGNNIQSSQAAGAVAENPDRRGGKRKNHKKSKKSTKNRRSRKTRKTRK